MRIMGLDYGSKTIGVAVSDPMGLTAQGLEIIRREEENKLRKSLRRIEELAKEYQVEEIVLGFPKNMNNTIGERAEKSLQLKETLERRLGLPVIMWDERLTTVEADRTLIEAGVRRENRKKICGYDSGCIYPAGLFRCKSKPGYRLISASNEPGGRACTAIWRLPQGLTTPL